MSRGLHPNLGPAPSPLERTLTEWHDWAIWKGLDQRYGTGFSARFQADLLALYQSESESGDTLGGSPERVLLASGGY